MHCDFSTNFSVFQSRCKLFHVKKSGEGKDSKLEPVECGIGELRLTSLDVNGSTKYRLLMRQEKTNKLLLNSWVGKYVKISRENQIIRFGTVDAEAKTQNYLFKLKEKNEVC